MEPKAGEVWLINFPFEEDLTQIKKRPGVVLDVDHEILKVLTIKVTKHKPKDYDKYDTEIFYWKEAKLKFKSTARISKTMLLDKDKFIHKIGDLHPDDLTDIQNKFIKFMQNNIWNINKEK